MIWMPLQPITDRSPLPIDVGRNDVGAIFSNQTGLQLGGHDVPVPIDICIHFRPWRPVLRIEPSADIARDTLDVPGLRRHDGRLAEACAVHSSLGTVFAGLLRQGSLRRH